MTQVAFVKTQNRSTGLERALDMLDIPSMRGKTVFLKPNFNSGDPPPGSTHNDTLRSLALRLKALGAERISIGDRSGMGNTRDIMEDKGIFALAEELGCQTVVFDELDASGWEHRDLRDSHWSRGFAVARPVTAADVLVQTCCLKTHRFGGHFTLALKNSVGMVAKQVPGDDYNYMSELHNSPDQRRMIAEINAAFQPDLIVLDGVEAFVEGGPDQGSQVEAQVVLAGSDPVAIDAVGVAILRHFGTTPVVRQGPIFEQEQIARAVELGLGARSPAEIQLVTPDAESEAYAAKIQEILAQG
jgi:uncharacterized protein (DUF362 family)